MWDYEINHIINISFVYYWSAPGRYLEARRVSGQLLQVVHWSGVLVPER